ncbi:probable E3 ubiquitin-protein ligase makorin-1 [Anopheles bellator]|uniref:probable E3 ubiquitin-protein ligase makorin-1 n=1 Tax=Anopheles bellator TaxID=139047 RepID=UPI00264A2141|nr:probable E3 ubiquitin-protein ligase makorin-1 [Anopheles bellator]XP_058063235.1 probable E3 ubiquitin-protein ligase makorin-1 [Anopheles bellator]
METNITMPHTDERPPTPHPDTEWVAHPTAPLRNTCQFFRLGFCRFGTECSLVHGITSSTDRRNTTDIVPTVITKDVAQQEHDQPQPSQTQSFSSSSPTRNRKATRIEETNQSTKSQPTTGESTAQQKSQFDPSKWINAPVFVPRSRLLDQTAAACSHDHQIQQQQAVSEPVNESKDCSASTSAINCLSYASIVKSNDNHNGSELVVTADTEICNYYERHGVCTLKDCRLVHGDLCELCGKYALHPSNHEQQRKHNAECIKQHELDMEHSFAVQRSRDKTCGICLEVIFEKPVREQRFGILPNCNHIFCLACIRTWRKASNFENKIKRACPTCRTSSDFVCPSIVWVEAGDEKDRLIGDYKKACKGTDCKHFRMGLAKCPFGNRCFYRHALPDGNLVDVGAPSRQHDRSSGQRRRRTHHLELQDFFAQILQQRGMLLDEFVTYLLSDEEGSDVSDLFEFEV